MPKFFSIDSDTIQQGRDDFNSYARAMICGTYDEDAYEAAMQRPGGIKSLPGAIKAIIELGIDDREGIVHAASRTTRCTRDTVESFLEAFTGPDPARHLFCDGDGDMYSHHVLSDATPPAIILAV